MENFTFEPKKTNKVTKIVYSIAPIFIWVSIVLIMIVLFAFIVFNYHDKPLTSQVYHNVKISEGNIYLETKDTFTVIPNDAISIYYIESSLDNMWCKVIFNENNEIEKYELHIPIDIANENRDVIFKNHPLH